MNFFLQASIRFKLFQARLTQHRPGHAHIRAVLARAENTAAENEDDEEDVGKKRKERLWGKAFSFEHARLKA